MANLAQKIKEELTERAKNSESCKKYLLDWVMNEFRSGRNPVRIILTDGAPNYFPYFSRELREKWLNTFDDVDKPIFIRLKYIDGKHYASATYSSKSRIVEITELDDAQRYAADGRDESDKRLFLESEGFHVQKSWVYGIGDVLEITY